uniref:Uncharacterized protein n=1 Tax=Eutreptiella gymnastica TaxID=73025 RepID=A0A6T2A8T6_9EUGL
MLAPVPRVPHWRVSDMEASSPLQHEASSCLQHPSTTPQPWVRATALQQKDVDLSFPWLQNFRKLHPLCLDKHFFAQRGIGVTVAGRCCVSQREGGWLRWNADVEHILAIQLSLNWD